MANILWTGVILNGCYSEFSYVEDGLTSYYTMTAEPLTWRWERMCRDAGRVLFGNILTGEDQ